MVKARKKCWWPSLKRLETFSRSLRLCLRGPSLSPLPQPYNPYTAYPKVLPSSFRPSSNYTSGAEKGLTSGKLAGSFVSYNNLVEWIYFEHTTETFRLKDTAEREWAHGRIILGLWDFRLSLNGYYSLWDVSFHSYVFHAPPVYFFLCCKKQFLCKPVPFHRLSL